MPTIEQLQRMLALDENDAFVLYGLAQEYAKLRDYPRAIAYFDRSLQSDPRSCYAYYHKARAQFSAGDPIGAAGTLDAGIAVAREIGEDHARQELEALRDEVSGA